MLADPEILEKLVLEQPEEIITSEMIPMISLDDSPQPMAEMVTPGDALEVIPGDEPESSTVEMEEQPVAEVAAPIPAVMLPSTAELTEVSVTADISAPISTIMTPSATELMELSADMTTDLPIIVVEPEITDMGLMIPDVSLESILPSMDLSSPQIDEAEVILAEIEIEQIHFEELEMESLPEIQAEELKLEPSAPQVAEDTVIRKRGSKNWRQEYSGATGVGFAYRDKMRLTLNALTIYPKTIAEKHRIEGRVVVRFVLNRAGELMETEIIDSSGHVKLDDAVKQMIQIAQPFEPLPDKMKNDKVAFAFPVTIKLQDR